MFYTSVTVRLFGVTLTTTDEGHEVLTRKALEDFASGGGTLPDDVNPEQLILGNIRTDVPGLPTDRRVPVHQLLKMLYEGLFTQRFPHYAHAMRGRNQSVPEAYHLMRNRICDGMKTACDNSLPLEVRTERFGSILHTLQDSFCIAHTTRADNSDPTSPILEMHTYPSREHPLSTKRDSIWKDKAQTAFREDAAAAIYATVEALKILAEQKCDQIDTFLDRHLAFREDIHMPDTEETTLSNFT